MSLDQIADNFVNFFKKPEGGTITPEGETGEGYLSTEEKKEEITE